MESVCRHFPPTPQLYFVVYLLSLLRTDMWRSDGFLPRRTVSIGSDGVRLPTFSAPPHLYLAVYLLSLSRTVSRRSDGLLPRQPVSIFSTPSSAILCCIFTKSLANCLPVSLVAHGLLPSDSVWVYWTTLTDKLAHTEDDNYFMI